MKLETKGSHETNPFPAPKPYNETKEEPLEMWLQWYGLEGDDEPGDLELVTWCSDQITKKDIRYVRADLYEQMQRRANSFELKAAKLEQQLEEVAIQHDLENTQD